MNFSTSPPCSRMVGTWQSKYRLSRSTSSCGGSRSDSAVKPRMSESQIAARISSTKPRRILPASSMARSTGDTWAKPPGRASAVATSRLTTP